LNNVAASAATFCYFLSSHMKRILILLGLYAAFGSALAQGQAAPRGHGGPVPTRNVLIFSKLENEWLDAVRRHDTEALARIVGEDFEIRSAAAPGVPTARDEALQAWAQLPAQQSTIGQMAVHEYGDVMLVSFMWKLGEQAFFVVDTWKRAGAEWKVAVRYAAPVVAGAAAVPGALAPSEQSLRKKM
jgi:ketosteroid isomerase-like protein